MGRSLASLLMQVLMISYADIAEAAFGSRARKVTLVLFVAELFFTCVAFLILASDSLHAIFPRVDIMWFRLVAFVVCTFG